MHFPKTTALLGIATAGAVALAPAAGATPAPGSLNPVKVTGAYLFVNTLYRTHERHATLVFRTDRPLSRRADGRIEADAGIAHRGGPRLRVRSSHPTGSASGAHCYQTGALIRKDNTIEGQANGRTTTTRAVVGSRLPVEIFIRTDDGFQRFKRTLTLRRFSPAYASGSALGC